MKSVSFLTLSTAVSQSVFKDEPTCSSTFFESDTDYHNGQGLGHAAASDAADCCAQCAEVSGCTYFTLADGTCWFKNSNGGKRSYKGAISGGTAPPPPAPPTPPPPPPSKVTELQKKYTALQTTACDEVVSKLPSIPETDANNFMAAFKNFTGDNDESQVLSLASSLLSASELGGFLSRSDSFISGGADSSLVLCAVLSQATPHALAYFGAADQAQEDVISKLLDNTVLMRDMLVAGGAKSGKYGEAMNIYVKILKASKVISAIESVDSSLPWDDRSQESVLHRFALGTALEQAEAMTSRFSPIREGETKDIDPVERYLHYEQAYLNGELDPAFEVLTAFEHRFVGNSRGYTDELTWTRETMRNFRPEHIVRSDYHTRYMQAVHTDVSYGDSQWVGGKPSYSGIPAAGAVCGGRAWFSRLTKLAHGLPTWGVQQPGHAAMTTWAPEGWTVLLGGPWQISTWEGRGGADFQLETQIREYRSDFQTVLRGQWVADALGEHHAAVETHGQGGLWSALMLYAKKVTIQNKGVCPAREVPSSKMDNRVEALIKRWAEKQPTPVITTGKDGTITIPAAAYSVKARAMSVETSADVGQQVMHNGGGDLEHYNQSIFEYEVVAEAESTFYLVMNFTTWHQNVDLLYTLNSATEDQPVPVFYSEGYWKETQPVEVNLVKGKNVLRFARRSGATIAIKEFFFYKVAPVIPTPDPIDVPVPTPPPTPTGDYIILPKSTTCASQGIQLMEEHDCSIAADFFKYKYTGSRSRDFYAGCFCLVTGPYAGNCNYNTNSKATATDDDARAVCLRHEYLGGMEII